MSGENRQSLETFCRQYGRTALLAEWDAEKNDPLTPSQVSHGSHQKIWWRCKEGHSWSAPVYTRTGGSGCPYCTGRKVQPGFNDLKSQFPALVEQWNFEKNAPVQPTDVSIGAHKQIWWLCEKGHSWRASVRTRVSGCGCPVCAGKTVVPGENDLASQFPEIAAQWDAEKNGALTPRQVTVGTVRKIWWLCEKGHSWQAAVAHRVRQKTGCPVCAGKVVIPGENDLASQDPALAAEWDTEKNGTLTPKQVTPASNRKAWWRCRRGHSYAAVISSRAERETGCPYCTNRKVLPGFNDLATVEPDLAKQWHPTLNGNLTPDMVTTGSHRRAWWQCGNGHVWRAFIYSRAGEQKCGCPVCAGNVRKRPRPEVYPQRPPAATLF